MDTLTNQEFLYRQTPVAYDGTGTLTSIKGNTINFNQLVQNGNFVDTSNWTAVGGTLSASGNVGTITNTVTSNFGCSQNLNTTQSHKYYVKFNFKIDGNITGSKRIRTVFSNGGSGDEQHLFYTPNTWEEFNALIVATNSWTKFYILTDYGVDYKIGTKINLKNVMVRDLTLMGIDNLTTVEEVKAYITSHLGNLDYFGFTLGTLIPFMGSGLKTTSKNLLDNDAQNKSTLGFTYTINEDGSVTVQGKRTSSGYAWLHYCSVALFSTLLRVGESYTLTGTTSNVFVYIENNKSIHVYKDLGSGVTFTYNGETNLRVAMYITASDDTQVNETIYPMIRLSSVSDPTFEPYISNTLSLSTLTYFPSGMKDCSKSSPVYDGMNLTSGKGNERVGSVDLGTLEWNYNSQYGMNSSGIQGLIKPPSANTEVANIACAIREVTTYNQVYSGGTSKNRIGIADNGVIGINTTETNPTSFKTQMSGVMLFFEKATPTEFDISLDHTYPVWKYGTEQILPINGSTPSTAPILCDIDYRGLIPVNAVDDPDGSGTITGTGNYRYHSMATLTATPTDEIYRFLRWEDENGNTLSTNATYTFEVGE